MKKIVLILLVLSATLFSGTLRILNIPVNSTIIVNGEQEYKNENKRSMNLDLENTGLLSTDVQVLNKYFLPYEFSVNISDDKTTVQTLEMQYAREFYTNILVEDVYGDLDSCVYFECKAESGDKIDDNLYKFRENIKDVSVGFSASRDGYYDETDTYDVDQNQLIIISPVSSWGLVSIGAVAMTYPADDSLKLSNGDEYMYYYLDDTQMYGAKLSYRKNTIFDFFLGVDFEYMHAEETYDEEDEINDGKNFTGTPTINVITLGVSGGVRFSRLFIGGGLRQEMVSISKAFTDKEYTYDDSRVAAYITADFLIYKIGDGGWSIGVNASTESLISASLSLMF